jgi:hypothetical protein
VKKVAVIGVIVLVAVGLLWLGFSGGNSDSSDNKTGNKPPPEVKWKGTMVLTTDNAVVTFNGRAAHCEANEVGATGHFLLQVTNYADQELVCEVLVKEGDVAGYFPGETSWLRLPPIPTLAPQKAGSIPVRVVVPTNTPDGKYALEVQVSKDAQVFTCPVLITVNKNKGTTV